MSFVIHCGDALTVLRGMPSESVQMCVTSPPYWGLRDYGVKEQLGLEPTPELYVARMVELFREVRRVLKDDGTLWLNLGDSYCSTAPGTMGDPLRQAGILSGVRDATAQARRKFRQATPSGLKPKDLIGIPWRVAFALQADGWWLRSDIIWHKPNPMPESVTDRPTKAHEYIFLLTKSARYYYDGDAVKEPYVESSGGWQTRQAVGLIQHGAKTLDVRSHPVLGGVGRGSLNGRNRRTVWTFATLPTPDAHFAVYPIDLPQTCILAGSREGDTVLDPFCGAGTTGLAAIKNGRQFVGIELNQAYIDIATKRLTDKYSLFAPADKPDSWLSQLGAQDELAESVLELFDEPKEGA